MSFVRSALVEDASGAQFEMHEFLIREPIFGYIRKRRRFELDTGEIAEPVDANTFRVKATGEPLMLVNG